MYSYLTDDGCDDKKRKGIKKGVIKQENKFEDYKNCTEANRLENEINCIEKNNVDVHKLKQNH